MGESTATTEPSAVLTIADMQHLVAALAPEFADSLAIVMDHPSLPRHQDCFGYFVRGRAWSAAHILKHIAAQPDFDGRLRDIIVMVRPTLEWFLHELGHATECRPENATYQPPTPADVNLSLRLVEKSIEWAQPFDKLDPDHDAKWLRRCIHLWVRAEHLGLCVKPHLMNLSGDGLYGYQDHPFQFRMTLNCECESMLRATFAQIASKPMPPAYIDLVLKNLFGSQEKPNANPT